MKKLLTIIALIIVITVATKESVKAQETSTPEATLTPQIILSPTPFPTPEIISSSSAILTPTPNPQSSGLLLPLITDTQPVLSAQLQSPISMILVSKKHLSGKENIVVQLKNAVGTKYTAKLFKDGKEENGFQIIKKEVRDTVVVSVNSPQSLQPGKYTLEVIDQLGNTKTQDFMWGVLAINTNKSIYLPGEQVHLSLAVLDEAGKMVCDAKMVLKIDNDTLNIHDELSTDNGKITVNPECSSHDYTEKPDYEALYDVKGSGVYKLTLTANTSNGAYTIEDAFEVRDSVLFDVERSSATRIYPPHSYPVKLKVTATEDFEGTITDQVPSNFEVTYTADNTVKEYAAVTTEAFKTDAGSVLGESTVQVALPFDKPYPITLGFAEVSTDPFIIDEQKKSGLSAHDGIDFAVPLNTPIKAVDDGFMIPILDGVQTYGNTVVIEHKWGRSYYGHLNTINFKPSEKIKKGDVIGLSGDTGISTGPHLHFGIRPNGYDYNNGYYGKVNPLEYLGLQNTYVLGANTSSSLIKKISWNVSLKKGETITLGYDYHAPTVSPEFYLLGPLNFIDKDGKNVFQEVRRWQIAVDAAQTFYTTTTAGASPYPTTSNLYSATNNSSSDVTTFAKNGKSAGFYQFKPSVTNTTSLGSTAASLPSNPANTGWVNTETQLDGQNTPAGTWTIGYKYSVTYTTTAPTTKNLWYRVLKVTCSAGSCTKVSAVSPTDAAAPASSGWSKTAIGTIPASTVLSTAQSFTFSGASTTWANGEKLYTEFAIETNTTNNNNGGWKLEQNTASDYVTTTNAAASSITVSGNIYQDESNTPWASCAIGTTNISIVVNGSVSTIGCTNGTGAFSSSVSGLTAANQVVVVFINATAKGVLYTHNNDITTAITGLKIITNRVSIRSESSSPITNANINSYDKTQNTNIPINSNGINISEFATPVKILIESGDTYAPGGDVLADSMEVLGTYTGATESATLSGAGTGSTCTADSGTVRPLCINGGTFTAPTTVNFTATSNANIEGTTYQNLRLGITADANAVTYTLAGSATASAVLTVGNSSSSATDTLAGSTYTLWLTGRGTPFNLTSKGTFTANTSTVIYTGDGADVTPASYNNLTVSTTTTFARSNGLGPNTGDNLFVSAVIDQPNGFAYFGTNTTTGTIVKFNLSTFTKVSTLTLAAGENLIRAGVIDQPNGFAYFGTNTTTAFVVKINLSTFTRVGAVTTSMASIYSATIDQAGGFAYFGSNGSPGKISKIDINPAHTFAETSLLTMTSNEASLESADIDLVGGYAYFAACSSPGVIVKVNLSTFGYTTLTLSTNSNCPAISVDSSLGYLYAAASDTKLANGRVVRVDLSTFTEDATTITLGAAEEDIRTTAIDTKNHFLYLAQYAAPTTVTKIDLMSFTKIGSAVSMGTNEDNGRSSVIDIPNEYLYIGSDVTNSYVAKVNIAIPTIGSATSQTITTTGNFIATTAGADANRLNPTVNARSLTINSGATYLASSTSNLTIGDDFTNNGTFTPGTGTVVVNDNTNTSTFTYSAATTFYNLNISTASKAMIFGTGATSQTNVTGALTLSGTSCATLLTLDSTSAGTQFNINATGTISATNVSVKDSNAIVAIAASASTNRNGNTNWSFNTACGSAPLNRIMKHGLWFNDSGVRQPFTF